MPTLSQNRRVVSVAAAALCVAVAARGHAAEPSELDLFALDDVLKAQTSIVSQLPRSVRDSPGVVTLITHEEMAALGARDLIDVLMLVPGFSFGTDVQGVVGPGFRGNWGHEGKVLLMVDGVEVNEPLFASMQLGNHYPVSLIDRVEVIRGPGSAIYGGTAELAVVNVVTRGSDEFRGVAAQAEYGQGEGGWARRGVSALLSGRTKDADALGVSIAASFSEAQRSLSSYRDLGGDAFSMKGNSGLAPSWVSAGVRYKDLYARFIFDDYRVTSGDGADLVVAPAKVGFTSYVGDVRYEWKLADGLTLIPRFQIRNQTPWQVSDANSPLFYDKSAQRVLGRLSLRWEPMEALHVTVGGEVAEDSAWLNSQSDRLPQPDFAGSNSVVYDNVAAFGEVLYENPIANLVAGARAERHSAFGSSFVPRVGATKVVGPFHAKLLLSGAFRAPSVENINQNDAIKPERTRVYEAEVGYRFSEQSFVSANVFDVRIEQPIIFDAVADPRKPGAYVDSYSNSGKTGTRGVELAYELRFGWVRAAASYSYYQVVSGDDVAAYQVPGQAALHLGMPAHKVTVSGVVRPWRTLSVAPSVVFLSDRYGYTKLGDTGDGQVENLGATLLANLYVSYHDLFAEGVEVGLGVYNITGEKFAFVQPYAGGHAPLPALGREVLLRLGYSAGR